MIFGYEWTAGSQIPYHPLHDGWGDCMWVLHGST